MKKLLLTVSIAVVMAVAALGLSACNLLENITKNKTTDDIPQAVEDIFVADKDGHFRAERTFNVNVDASYDYEELHYTNVLSTAYVFKTDGSYTLSGKVQRNAGQEDVSEAGTYRVISNLIELTKGESKEYLDYYSDVIFVPLYLGNEYVGLAPGVEEGVAASQRSNSTVGYHIDLKVRQGDLIAVFNGEKKTSKGTYTPVRSNATVYETAYKGISADQIQGFDSSQVGNVLVDVVINKKTYKAVLRVVA